MAELFQIGSKHGREITERYYFTMWFDSAAGYSDKLLDEVKKAIEKSGFPNISSNPVIVSSGGCLSMFGSEKFEAIKIVSNKTELDHFGCLYKATEFGNILHISLLFYTDNTKGCVKALQDAFKLMFKAFLGGATIKEQEYQEVFQRLFFMVVHEASSNLGVEAIHSEFDHRGNAKTDKSGLGGILSSFT